MNARQHAVGLARLARSRWAFLLGLIVATSAAAESHWWMGEPVRLLQTNLRETDSTLDSQRLIRQVAEFPANALLFNMGGLFFNMFGNPSADYSGNPMGPCQCGACRTRFQARYHRPLPTNSRDADYGEFLAASAREVAAMLAELIHRLRPQAAFLTYIQDYTDGIMSESNTAVGRALPLWPYSASDNVNRARNSEPDKMAFNLCMSFVDYPWRFVTVPPAEIRLRLHQSLAHGGALALNLHGTLD